MLITNYPNLMLSLLFQTSLPCCVFACVVSGTSFCCCHCHQGNTSDGDDPLWEDTQHNSIVCSYHTWCTYPPLPFTTPYLPRMQAFDFMIGVIRRYPKSVLVEMFLARWRPRNWFGESWQGRQSIGFCRCQRINSGWYLSCLIIVVCLHNCQCSLFRHPIIGKSVFK